MQFARRLAAYVAAFALIQAMAAPLLAACDGSHDTVAAVTADETGPAGTGHSECPESAVPQGKTGHSDDCQESCLSMLGCTSLSFVGTLMVLDAPDELLMTPAPAPLALSNRSLTPESPPPRA